MASAGSEGSSGSGRPIRGRSWDLQIGVFGRVPADPIKMPAFLPQVMQHLWYAVSKDGYFLKGVVTFKNAVAVPAQFFPQQLDTYLVRLSVRGRGGDPYKARMSELIEDSYFDEPVEFGEPPVSQSDKNIALRELYESEREKARRADPDDPPMHPLFVNWRPKKESRKRKRKCGEATRTVESECSTSDGSPEVAPTVVNNYDMKTFLDGCDIVGNIYVNGGVQ